MSPLETKRLLVFVKLLLLYRLKAHADGDNQCIQTQIKFSSGDKFVHPSGYTILQETGSGDTPAVGCQEQHDQCNIWMIYPGRNFSRITLNINVLSHQDVIVILDTESQHYQCVSVFTSKTGYCWNKGQNISSSSLEIKCNDILSDPSSCKNFNENGMLIIGNNSDPVCNACQVIDPSNSMNAGNILHSLITSNQNQLGNATAVNITAGNITGVLIKLQNASNINVGITQSGATKILQSKNDAASLFSSVEIPAEATSMAESQNSTLAAVMLFLNIKPPGANSIYFNNSILAIEMEANITNLTQPVKITLNNVDKKGGNASCISWNGKANSNWTTDGCNVRELSSSITCECYHLTFFALLISPPQNISSSDYNALSYITSVGCGLSMLFLAVGLFIHCLIRKGKASRGTKILMNLFVAMFLLDLSFLVNESIADLGIYGACVATAAVMHYAMLATVSWFFVEALHLYYNLWRSPSAVKHYMIRMGIMGWGPPAVVVTVMLIMQKYDLLLLNVEGGTTSKLCWIPDAVVQQGVNVGYYAVVFVFTFAMFIATVRQVVLFQPRAEKAGRSVKSKTASVLGLLLLLGITWAVAFFSYGPLLIPSYYIFTILNSFQGFFLFIYYYKTGRIIVDERSLKDKSNSTCTSKTAVTAHI